MIIGNYIELLEQNKNLILTGAPGTGKTYLAKQIASQFCLGKDYEEVLKSEELKKEFESQCGFVQFHPSYDYTDFVEGLRPINIDGNSNIGFERIDGVFKEFCKRALENYENSKKDFVRLKKEVIIKKYLILFTITKQKELLASIDKQIILHGLSDTPVAPFIDINYDGQLLTIVSKSIHQYTIKSSISNYVNWYLIFEELVKNDSINTMIMEDKTGVKGKVSYLCAFLLAFYNEYHSIIEEENQKEVLKNEKEVEKKNFVFIIDEINRGEISKIFGELFFSIDAGYRGEAGKVLTQYSNLIENEKEKYFYIPENVYIIGTMNDIDRSVESMDFAMRRRFAWRKVDPTDTQSMLDTLFEKVIEDNNQRIELIEEVKRRMNNLNGEIENTRELSSHYKIGASYFLKLENYYENDNLKEAFDKLWEYHLKGLLFEYLHGFSNQDKLLDNLKNAYEKVENDIIVEDSNTENNNEE